MVLSHNNAWEQYSYYNKINLDSSEDLEALEEKKALLLAQFEQDFKLSPEEDSESDSEGLYLHDYMSRMILVNVSLKFKFFFLGMKGTMDG